MPEQIYIGNFAKGLKLDRLPFNIDNDSFATMYNFYSWRGRAKRKRGTLFLGQLELQVQSVLNATPPASWQVGQIGLASGAGNLLGTFITNITQATQAVVTITGSIFSVGQQVNISGVVGMTQINGGPYTIVAISPTSMTLNVNSSAFSAYVSGGVATLAGGATITPGSIDVTVGGQTYAEPSAPNGTLIGSGGGTGTINYATGAITITGGGSGPLTGTLSYFPGLPVMGLRDFVSTLSSSQYPLLLAFDTEKAYQINQSMASVFFYNVSFYKGTNTPVIWDGQDYQLFWTTNYSGALWATNNVPGFHFVTINSTITWVSATQLMIVITGTPGQPPVIVGDMIWTNEITTTSTVNAAKKLASVNGQSGTVAIVVESPAGTFTITINFPNSNIIDPATGDAGNVYQKGIFQLLTNSIAGQDGIRWYDGDPTGGTGLPTGTGLGWVNFSPPLTAISVSIDDTPSALYYLVGALAIVPFKDRLLFFSPYIQTSTGTPIKLQDTVLWSWNGTPYYTSPVPAGETFNTIAYYVDQIGVGGYLPAGISQPIITVSNNEDVLLVGFGGNIGRQTRLAYTGDDLNPFLFFNINQELGSSSTFSAIALDRGALTIGSHGIVQTTQQSAQRIDLDIPDSVFDIQALNNGVLRVNAIRDYYKEWVYFSYPVNDSAWKFPTQTFLYNYRDSTWAILYENFTTHGTYRKQTHYTWATLPFKTWSQWREPWNAGSTSALFPDIVAGNPQGYVLIIGQGTGEGISGTIDAIANNLTDTQITSINHCVAVNDYLLFQGALGTINSVITNITQATQAVITTTNTFSFGQYVQISEVVGMTQINGRFGLVLAATGSSITVGIDTTGYSAYVSGGVATIAPMQMQIGKVLSTADANTFVVDVPYFNLGYIGLGHYTRLSQPLLQTKQFPVYWEQGRQVRLCAQKYLLDTTANSQITVNISLSQDPNSAYNSGSIVPITDPDPTNNSLVYSQVLYTCPESTNIGLTPANMNLQMPTAASQYQIWHRFNTSLIGDTFQIGFTLSNDTPGHKDSQMRILDYATNEITLHGMHLTVEKGPHLA